MTEDIHPEITCPYCRIGFGGFKVANDAVTHLDIFYGEGLVLLCKQQDYVKKQILEIDEHQNPIFNEEYQKKLDELREMFENNPIHIDKNNFSLEDFFIAFNDCVENGSVGGEKNYVFESVTDEKKIEEYNQKLISMYNEGKNLKEVLESLLE